MTRDDVAAGVPAPSGTVTFLFSDVEGSTQRWDRDRAAMQEALRRHDEIMRGAFAARGGYVFKTIGDAFCAAFATPEAAANAAVDAQRALAAADFCAVDGLRVRMAINTGTADERDGDYFGPTLNLVARLLPLGHGGQVLMSGIAADLVGANPPAQASLDDLGRHLLKDIAHPERVYQLVAPGLQRHFPDLRARVARMWLVPDAARTRYFTGREGPLDLLRRQLVARHRAALCGLGGVGKTQTAIEYAMRHRDEYENGVFWVNAERVGGLTSGFVEIAKALGLAAATSSDQDLVVHAVLEWFGETGRWLLIFDNVDDRRIIRRFVPESVVGDIVLTSRESVFQELGIARAIEITDFDRDESARFLLARTGRGDGDASETTAALELADELGHLPLALEQAAAYIAETSGTFGAYLTAYRKRRVSLLEKAGELVSHETVAVTWAANFAAVEAISPASADLLRVSAFLASDAIPYDLFSKGAQALGELIARALADADDLAIIELLRPLTRYSLVRSDAKAAEYGVHRLVQEIVRSAIAESDRRAYVERVADALGATFPHPEYATWAQCDRLVPHVTSIAEWVHAYDVCTEGAGAVLSQTGWYLIERGRYSEAELLHERALAIRERSLGSDHRDVADSLNRLATLHWYQGRYAEALPLFERALAIRERAFGPEHPTVATTLNNYANVLANQGRSAEAQPLYERALTIRESALGQDHPDVARSLHNLAELPYNRGRYAEAEALYARAAATLERALGPDHPDVATSLSALAKVYVRQARLAEARRTAERALAIHERALGPDHPLVAASLDALANVHVEQRRASAMPLAERALSIAERSLGRDHPDVAGILDTLARISVQRRRFLAADALYERALGIRERVLGTDHPEMTQTLVGLASLREHQGRAAEAAVFLERALAANERTLLQDRPDLADIHNRLAKLR
jgi:class 3 adenylate cyclase/tetratricopeptide (TPR) repeat protein